jgi:tetratricopeptide (TPR) repeat protein
MDPESILFRWQTQALFGETKNVGSKDEDEETIVLLSIKHYSPELYDHIMELYQSPPSPIDDEFFERHFKQYICDFEARWAQESDLFPLDDDERTDCLPQELWRAFEGPRRKTGTLDLEEIQTFLPFDILSVCQETLRILDQGPHGDKIFELLDRLLGVLLRSQHREEGFWISAVLLRGYRMEYRFGNVLSRVFHQHSIASIFATCSQPELLLLHWIKRGDVVAAIDALRSPYVDLRGLETLAFMIFLLIRGHSAPFRIHSNTMKPLVSGFSRQMKLVEAQSYGHQLQDALSKPSLHLSLFDIVLLVVRCDLGMSRVRSGDIDDLFAHLSSKWRKKPLLSDDHVLTMHGIWLQSEGQHECAHAVFREAVLADPSNCEATFRLALLQRLAVKDNDDEAIRLLGNVLRVNQRHAAARVELGDLHLARGELVQARTCFEFVLNTDPSHQRAASLLQRCIAQEGGLMETTQSPKHRAADDDMEPSGEFRVKRSKKKGA